jgi:hypothetical protein
MNKRFAAILGCRHGTKLTSIIFYFLTRHQSSAGDRILCTLQLALFARITADSDLTVATLL